MGEQLSGSFWVECFWNGNPLDPSCGSMANVSSLLAILDSPLMVIHLLSGLREEYPLVSHH